MSKTRVVDKSLSAAIDGSSPAKKAGIDDPGSRYRALLFETANSLIRAMDSDNADLLDQLRAEIPRLRKAVALLGRDLNGELRPQVGDLVCGTLLEVVDHQSEWFRIHGKVVGVEELGKVTIRFSYLERMDGDCEAFEAKAVAITAKEYESHEVSMAWDDSYDEWSLDF